MAQDQVDEIKQKIDIVSIIGEYIDLKKAGKNFKAPCPFHSEKLPSFVVSPELQIYKCFGCGVSGDVFTFLQEYEGMDFYEALKLLADRVGVKLKPISGDRKSQKEKFFEINSLAKRFYKYVLLKHNKGEKALDYLKSKRRLKTSTIDEFELGFCPDDPFAIKSFLVDKKGYSIDDLTEAGIAVKTSRGVIDRFRGRVIFPLHDHRGNVLGFAGRIMSSRKDIAKYINSPDTPVYHKSNVLYGLNHVRSIIKKKGWAIIVEGELDMISSWQVGVKNAVAIKGSAITEEQVRLLSRYTNKVILALDADLAGDAAAMRGIKVLQGQDFEIKVAKLIDYKDPDDYAHNDPEGYKKKLKDAKNVWDYLIDSIFEKYDQGTGSGKAKISSDVIPILSSISDSIVQAHYVRVVSERLGVTEDVVIKQVEKSSSEPQDSKSLGEGDEGSDKPRRQLLEERLLALSFKNDLKTLEDKKTKKLITSNLPSKILKHYLEYAKENSKFIPSDFAEHIPKELFSAYSDMLLKDESDIDVSLGIENEVEEMELIVKELEKLDLKKRLEDITKKIKDKEGKKGSSNELKKLEKSFAELTKEYTILLAEE
ncbi:DNA primase [Candidatus Woesebacteria bacterium]|nr:DNA primase [Candidatus Woesebacteria bacterium]